MALPQFKVTYGAFVLPQTNHTIIDVWVNNQATLEGSIRFDVLITAIDQDDLATKIDTFRTAMLQWNKILLVQTVDDGGTAETIIDIDHALNKGMLSRPSITKPQHELNTTRSKVLTVNIKWQESALFIGTTESVEGFIEGTFAVATTGSFRRTVTITGKYRATPLDAGFGSAFEPASDNLKDHFLTQITSIITALIGTSNWEVIQPESYTIDDRDKTLNGRIVVQEIFEDESSDNFNEAALVNVDYSATINTPDMGATILEAQAPVIVDTRSIVLLGQVSYSAQVDRTVNDPDTSSPWVLRKLFLTKVKPFIVTRLLTLQFLSKYTLKIARLVEKYNPTNNTFTVVWNVYFIPKNPTRNAPQSSLTGPGAAEAEEARRKGLSKGEDQVGATAGGDQKDFAFSPGSVGAKYLSYSETIVERLDTNIIINKIGDGVDYSNTNYEIGKSRFLVHTVNTLTLDELAPLPTLIGAPWKVLSIEPTRGPDQLAVVDVSVNGTDAELSLERAFRRQVSIQYQKSIGEIVGPRPFISDPRGTSSDKVIATTKSSSGKGFNND